MVCSNNSTQVCFYVSLYSDYFVVLLKINYKVRAGEKESKL